MPMPEGEWKSIYRERPQDGAICTTRRSGEEGYCGRCVYDATTATFRTYEDKRNRLIITVWKCDEWMLAING